MIIFACNKILMNPIMSFVAEKVVMDGLTFDDVLLIPAYPKSFLVMSSCRRSFHAISD